MPNVSITSDVVDVGTEYGFTSGTTGQPVDVYASQAFVTINGVNVIKQGDAVQNHYDFDGSGNVISSHDSSTMVSSKPYVTINGDPVVVNGDRASCSASHTIVGGGFVTIS